MEYTASDRPSHRGETWNDTEQIDRHRSLTPATRAAMTIEVSRAALRFAQAGPGPTTDAAFAPERSSPRLAPTTSPT